MQDPDRALERRRVCFFNVDTAISHFESAWMAKLKTKNCGSLEFSQIRISLLDHIST